MSSDFYYLKNLIPLDSIYEIKYFTKGFKVEWLDLSNQGFCPIKISYGEDCLIVHWKNDTQFGEMITHFEREDIPNNNPMDILNLLNSHFNLEWKE
jgi:hypothetical protein